MPITCCKKNGARLHSEKSATFPTAEPLFTIMSAMHYPLFLLLIIICSCQNDNESPSARDIKNNEDFSSQIIKTNNDEVGKNIPAPIELRKLRNTPYLDWTSGLGIANGKYCDSTKKGFYGFYYLIDKRNLGTPRAGEIVIYKQKNNVKWTANDTTQKFRHVHLKSDVLKVWDSIYVGLSEKKLYSFIGEDNFHYKKGTLIYSIIGGYACNFFIHEDTITEIEITLLCDK